MTIESELRLAAVTPTSHLFSRGHNLCLLLPRSFSQSQGPVGCHAFSHQQACSYMPHRLPCLVPGPIFGTLHYSLHLPGTVRLGECTLVSIWKSASRYPFHHVLERWAAMDILGAEGGSAFCNLADWFQKVEVWDGRNILFFEEIYARYLQSAL